MTPLSQSKLSRQGWALSGLLLLTLGLFIAGHLTSRGALWNHVTGETFSPWRNYVSDYAYRSPTWPAFIACMYAFGGMLGIISWKIFRIRPGRSMVTWLMTVLLAYAGLKLIEVAVFPVKPPEVNIDEIQSRMDQGSWARLREDLGSLWNGAQPSRTSAWEVVDAFGNNRGHMIGIRGAMPAVLAAIILGLFLDVRRIWRWRIVSAITLILLTAGMLFSGHALHGLFQRIAFSGIYIWMWLVVLTLFRKPRKCSSSKVLKPGSDRA